MTRKQLDLDPVPQGNAECALQLQATGRNVEDRNRLVAPVAVHKSGNRCRASLVLAAKSRRLLGRLCALRLGAHLHRVRLPSWWKPDQSLAPPCSADKRGDRRMVMH